MADQLISVDISVSSTLDMFVAGGPVAVILLGLSVVALAVILLKLWQFHAVRIGRRRPLEAALAEIRARRPGRARALLAGERNPIARVMEVAVNAPEASGREEALLREEVQRVGARELEILRSHFRTLEVIGTLSPLLGLFGTVLGMIEAFRQLETAGSRVDPAILSGGIWEALLTTAIGLAVAIPAVAALNWLERKVERLRHDMEDAATRLFTMPYADSRLPYPRRDQEETYERMPRPAVGAAE